MQGHRGATVITVIAISPGHTRPVQLRFLTVSQGGNGGALSMLLMLCGFARKVAMLIVYNCFVLWCLSSCGGKGGNFRSHFFHDTLQCNIRTC